jgi:hypothetical protein
MRDQPLYLELVSLAEATAAAHHALSDKTAPRARDGTYLAELRRETALALAAVGTVYSRSEQRPLSFSEVEVRIRADLADLCMRRSELLRCIELLRASAAQSEARRLREWSAELIETSQDAVAKAGATLRRSQRAANN